MKEVKGNIWDYYDKGHWIVITTNGTVKANGEAVMGRGVAVQAKQRLPTLPCELGRRLQTTYGNIVYFFKDYHLITLPTKRNWWEKSDISLIEKGIRSLLYQIKQQWEHKVIEPPLYLVRPGCSNGQLDWKDVKPVLEKYLDDRFIIVERREK